MASRAPAAPDGDFAAIYHAHFAEVTRWIRALGGPECDVEDIAQEVFLVVRRKLASFDGRNLPGWLYRIAQLTVSDWRRRAWFVHLFKGRRPLPVDREAPGDPARELERKQDQRTLYLVLDKLSPARRETFVLFEILGYTGDEIARLQDVPVNTVWTRLHHARKEFVARVAELGDGDRRSEP
jgi:RNA polymerase sigma-70 factor (ECF subfamily)